MSNAYSMDNAIIQTEMPAFKRNIAQYFIESISDFITPYFTNNKKKIYTEPQQQIAGALPSDLDSPISSGKRNSAKICTDTTSDNRILTYPNTPAVSKARSSVACFSEAIMYLPAYTDSCVSTFPNTPTLSSRSPLSSRSQNSGFFNAFIPAYDTSNATVQAFNTTNGSIDSPAPAQSGPRVSDYSAFSNVHPKNKNNVTACNTPITLPTRNEQSAIDSHKDTKSLSNSQNGNEWVRTISNPTSNCFVGAHPSEKRSATDIPWSHHDDLSSSSAKGVRHLIWTFEHHVVEAAHYRKTKCKDKENLKSINSENVLELFFLLGLSEGSNSANFSAKKAEISQPAFYTEAIFDIYENIPIPNRLCTEKKLTYIVKFYKKEVDFLQIGNLIDVKKYFEKQEKDPSSDLLPRLCFHLQLGELELAREYCYFTVLEAATGELARDIFDGYKKTTNPRTKLRIGSTTITDSIKLIGNYVGAFHCHHASSYEEIELYVNGHRDDFKTIIHKDLHLGNIFVDLVPHAKTKVTFIDLESMNVSCIDPHSNTKDLACLKTSIHEFLENQETAHFDVLLDEAYKTGIRNSLETRKRGKNT